MAGRNRQEEIDYNIRTLQRAQYAKIQCASVPCFSPFQTLCCEWGLTKLNIYNYTGFHTISGENLSE